MSLKQTALYQYIIFVLILSASPALLFAEISTDGTVGAAQTLNGPDYAIPETLGTIRGSNLFHSFDKFSIKREESATFTGSDSIKNVISRVTGGEKSEIDGTLRSNVGKADFYFINPNGVVFGENAKIDVPAAFHASTGNELKFKDSASFKASKTEQSTLTQAAPEAFGFLGTQSASIEINGSTLQFKPESKVSLTSSKDITIKGTEKETTTGAETKQASLVNAGGEIELKVKGDLLMDNAIVESSGNGGGKIGLKAENAKLNMSKIRADNTGYKNSDGGINVDVDKMFELINGSYMSSSTWSKGNAGSIKIKAESMKIDRQNSKTFTGLTSSAEEHSSGKAGTVEIAVEKNLEIINGSTIGSGTFSKGDGGNIKIRSANLKIDGQGSNYFTGVASSAEPKSEGNAGMIEIKVSELLELLNGAIIRSSTFSKGDAGDLKITASNMKIDGKNSRYLTCISSSSEEINSKGKSGTIEINISKILEVLNGGQILSETWSKGDSGNVKINAGNLKINGQGSRYFTGVATSSEPNSEGNAGTIEITVASILELLKGGTIASSTWSKGDAGSIKIKADGMKIDSQNSADFTGIASSSEKNSEGRAGIIKITVNEFLEMINGCEIRSSAFSKGDAGDVKLYLDTLIVDSSWISSDAYSSSTGYVGNIEINSDSIILLNGRGISIEAHQTLPEEKLADMPEKSITLNTNRLIIQSESKVTSESTKNVPASDININADTIYLHDGLITTSVEGTNGDGGNITINNEADPADILVMKNGFIQANSKAKGGTGGRITINADRLLKESDATLEIGGDEIQQFQAGSKRNIIQAAAPEGNPKNDDIKSPTVPIDIGGSIINADSKIAKPVDMAENYCRFIGTKKTSRLTRGGRGGIPPMLSEPSSIFFTDERLEKLLKYEKQKEKENEI